MADEMAFNTYIISITSYLLHRGGTEMNMDEILYRLEKMYEMKKEFATCKDNEWLRESNLKDAIALDFAASMIERNNNRYKRGNRQ